MLQLFTRWLQTLFTPQEIGRDARTIARLCAHVVFLGRLPCNRDKQLVVTTGQWGSVNRLAASKAEICFALLLQDWSDMAGYLFFRATESTEAGRDLLRG